MCSKNQESARTKGEQLDVGKEQQDKFGQSWKKEGEVTRDEVRETGKWISNRTLLWRFAFYSKCDGKAASQVVLVVMNPPANAGDLRDVGLILGKEDPLEEAPETHSSSLAWRIPWTEEPSWL